ncbi:nuclear autoantigenic sperm protein isoform X7 [Monodelphis domestica]|uniref:nuclear autoantigenic sperm protein isoform X7 n=1 Tax=Monodelphis domestica TaxID=13616 RepID=UPI0007B404CB|nr:nuclear autoantigenic sperm protein isoform X7 [Monodelphis domestica]
MAAEPAAIAELDPADKREEEAPAPSTSTEKTDSLDVDSESKKLLGLGQKHLVMGDIPAAVNAFQEAASLLMENGVLGNALDGVPVDEDGEKAEDESMVESSDNVDETEGSEEDDKENDREAEEPGNDSKLENKSVQENEDEDIGNLELAWDMLDLAKIIFKRQETKEAQLNAAQAHLKLGEVSIESENYSQAIEEFQACLALQQNYLEAHDRLLAETHYQLGLAYSYNSQYGEAVSQFTKSVDVIEKRLAMLNERIKAAEAPSAEDEKEIEELKELLPEIKEKIEDAKESQSSGNVAELALKATLVQAASGFTSSSGNSSASGITARRSTDGAATTSSNCVTDISHLVRKKRKPEEESPRKDAEAKKPKQEPAVNGGSGDGDGGGDAAPTTNEAAENMEAEAENQPPAESGAATVQSTA